MIPAVWWLLAGPAPRVVGRFILLVQVLKAFITHQIQKSINIPLPYHYAQLLWVLTGDGFSACNPLMLIFIVLVQET